MIIQYRTRLTDLLSRRPTGRRVFYWALTPHRIHRFGTTHAAAAPMPRRIHAKASTRSLVYCQFFHMRSFRRFFAQNFSVLLSDFICNFFNAITAFFSFPYLHIASSDRQPRRLQILRPSHFTTIPAAPSSRPAPPCILSVFFTCTRSAAFRSVSRPVDWGMRSFCPHSIGQCVHFASGRLTNVLVLHPVDWPMHGRRSEEIFWHRSGVGAVQALDA